MNSEIVKAIKSDHRRVTVKLCWQKQTQEVGYLAELYNGEQRLISSDVSESMNAALDSLAAVLDVAVKCRVMLG